ncbi:MAG: serine hydrolase domain-containing protein [Acidimicrobiales bacterium]
MSVLAAVDAWGARHAAVAVYDRAGTLHRHGPTRWVTRIASVAKVLTAHALLVAVEEGSVGLDDPAGPPGATLRHLLSHSAGYGFDGDEPVAAVGARRIYSNTGIERAAAHLEHATGIGFATYLAESVLEPLGMVSTELRGSPAHGLWSCVDDLIRFVDELRAPRLVTAATLADAVAVQFPGLSGILPGVGRFDPLDWGLGVERNFGRAGHWTGTTRSRATFGHFGGSGTFLWVDPDDGTAAVCVTDRDFGEWARTAWPAFHELLL